MCMIQAFHGTSLEDIGGTLDGHWMDIGWTLEEHWVDIGTLEDIGGHWMDIFQSVVGQHRVDVTYDGT